MQLENLGIQSRGRERQENGEEQTAKLNSLIVNDNEMNKNSKQMQHKEIDKANYAARAEKTEAAEKVKGGIMISEKACILRLKVFIWS